MTTPPTTDPMDACLHLVFVSSFYTWFFSSFYPERQRESVMSILAHSPYILASNHISP